MYGYSRTEHTIEPDPRHDIHVTHGEHYEGRCHYCGAPIEGNDNGAWHTDDVGEAD